MLINKEILQRLCWPTEREIKEEIDTNSGWLYYRDPQKYDPQKKQP